ncbi:DNA-binding protein [Streptomyces griseoaurantiacus]|uniref:DNA-binding protein n=1 Tax=Streptomyces griseoaurantiacus TaxID=68213 RepID=UPI00379B405E
MRRGTLPPTRRPLATVPEIAEHYGVPQKTVHYWHQTQTGPGPLLFRVGKYLRARWDDIDQHDANQAGGQRAA